MITATFTPTSLIVRGHAEFDELGKDIVCAAASAYVYQLIAVLALEENAGVNVGARVKTESGDAEIVCADEAHARAAIEYCKVGFLVLQSRYPDNVRVIC